MKMDGGAQFAGPATVVAAPTQATPASQPTDGCSCAVPADAPPAVKQTRIFAIVVIGTHAVALFVLGFYLWATWIGTLCGIIAASVLLCCYKKECYTCTGATWVVAAIFDLISAIFWLGTHGDYGHAWVSIFSIIALISVIPGVVCAFKACTGWVHPDAQGAAGGSGGPVVTVGTQGHAPGATVHHMPQQQGPPPAYGANV